MRKQIDFAFRQMRYDAIEPEFSSARVNAWVKENYLDLGWEVLRAEVVRAEANSVFVALFFVKYESVDDEVRESVPARRGRPPKVVEVDAVS